LIDAEVSVDFEQIVYDREHQISEINESLGSLLSATAFAKKSHSQLTREVADLGHSPLPGGRGDGSITVVPGLVGKRCREGRGRSARPAPH